MHDEQPALVLEPLEPTPTASAGGTRPYGMIVQAAIARDLDVAARTIRTLGRRLSAFRAAGQEARIERLVEAMIAQEPLSAVDEAIEVDNAALRARYLETVPTFAAADLHDLAGSTAGNRSALASRWKADRRVFAVPYKGVDRFPGFQFADGQPRPVIRRVLTTLPEGMTPWQTAFWFASGNGWLDDAAPQACLGDEAAVVAAAERMREPAVG